MKYFCLDGSLLKMHFVVILSISIVTILFLQKFLYGGVDKKPAASVMFKRFVSVVGKSVCPKEGLGGV